MPVYNPIVNVYAEDGTLASLFPQPIIALRDPSTSDLAPIGQAWVNKVSNTSWILTSIANNTGTWSQSASAGDVFPQLTVNPGNLTVTAGNFDVTLGTMHVGGLSTLNGINNTGAFTQLGATNINISTNANTNIATGTNNGSLVLGNVANSTDLQSIITTVSGSFTVNGATTINDNINKNTNINTTSNTGTFTVGNTANSGLVSLLSSDASGILLKTGVASACNVSLGVTQATSANTSDTFTTRIGSFLLTNAAYAALAGATGAVFTLTNNLVTTTSVVFASAHTKTGNNVALAVSCQPTANTLTFKIFNTDPLTAVSGNVILNFWVMN